MDNEPMISPEEHVAQYLQRVLQARAAPATPGAPIPRGAGRIGAEEYWADAPWRLEPDQDSVPLTFLLRDGPGAQVHLEEIAVSEAADDGLPWPEKDWRRVRRFTAELGVIDDRYWSYHLPGSGDPLPRIPLQDFTTICHAGDAAPGPLRGRRLLLKVTFKGERGGGRPFEEARCLSVFLAAEPLPVRHSPQWYYGDTHYHSNYTNDIKEFGNPVPATRAAAMAMGLDWLVITDHSVDLADRNPYWLGALVRADARWEALGREVHEHSDHRFRLLRGEEVTLIGQPGKGDDTLHMLAFGTPFARMIPGAFARSALLDKVAAFLSAFSEEAFAHLFGHVYRLEEVLTGATAAGEPVAALEGRSVQAQGALAFAAHPASFAQAPGGTWGRGDIVQPIHGLEAWNGRPHWRSKQQACPFDDWQGPTTWEDDPASKGIAMWDQALQDRVDRPDPRFVLLAGSDAHGSFNYSEGWWVDWDGLTVDDNGLGKVRTLLYLPHRDPGGPRQAPNEGEVVDAIRSGSCVVTDGPVLNLTLGCGEQKARLGEVMDVRGDGSLDVYIQAASTAEFGPVRQVSVVYYLQGMAGSVSRAIAFQPGHTAVLVDSLPAGSGYVRLETVTEAGGEAFHCFTNPIWIRSEGPRSLRVHCTGGIEAS